MDFRLVAAAHPLGLYAGISSIRMPAHRDRAFHLLFQLAATESPDTEPFRYLDDPDGVADRLHRLGVSRIFPWPHLQSLWWTRQRDGLHAHLLFSGLLLRCQRCLDVPELASPHGG